MIESIVNLEKQCRKSGNLEFNEGKLTRYLREMTDEEVELCNQRLGPLIERMGFEIEASC